MSERRRRGIPAEEDLAATVLFLRQWLRDPRSIAAIAPSGRELARRIAGAVGRGAKSVVEIGAGTGAVTQALLDSGVPAGGLLVIERNGGGHILTMHSVLSWLALGGSYSASKAALWSQTNSLRLDLAPRGIAVTGMHMAYVDTDLAAGTDAPKSDPRTIAALALDGIETGAHEILGDDLTRQVKSGLAGDLTALYPQLAQ